MKITNCRIIVCCPGRNFVTLKIETDQGVHGIGDATLNGRELAVAAYLTEHIVPTLIGRDPARIEDIWQYLYRGAYWRRGPVTMSAIAAVDTALWDLKGKMAGMPLYELLGGKSRDGVMVYGHANGKDIAETLDEVARYIDLGYKAIRATSRRTPRFRPKMSGPRRSIWTMRQGCSTQSARASVSVITFFTTCTIASRRSRPRGWANRLNPIACSGWRTRRRRRTRKASG